MPLVAGRGTSGRAQAPRPGGTLKMAWASSPRTLDPALTIQGDEYMITQNVYDNLTRVDEKLQPQPHAGHPVELGRPGAKIWTFTLRQGVKFHHGGQLTARATSCSPFERILDPKTASPGRTALGPIEKVEAVDDYTVRFRMAAPYADLPREPGGDLRPHPARRPRRQDRDRAVGDGAVPAGRVQAGRADAHGQVRGLLGQAGKPYLDELWQVNMPQPADPGARRSAGGDVQMMFEVPVPFIGVARAERRASPSSR